ncbi:MAG: Sec-independent protein translocase protein TatB [Lysobacter sp.]|nr:Sec-independent protein translocase protein TatB [Lysobacter sp.]
MFDIGFSELLMIAVVALIVLGPERLPKAARFAGLWVRRARAQWYSVKSELERDFAADELRRSLGDAQDAFRDTEQSLREHSDAVRRGFDTMAGTVNAPVVIADDADARAVDPAPSDDPPDTETSETDDAPR